MLGPVTKTEGECPGCGISLARASEIGGFGEPEAGGLGICDSCACIFRYDDDLQMIPLTESDLAEIAQIDPEAASTLMTFRARILGFRSEPERN